MGVLGRTYDNQNCSVARTLEVVGERWTLLILRDAFFGITRFADFAADLGVARNILQERLTRLVDEGLMERVQYQDRPVRFEYRLTPKGEDLWPVLMSLMHYGDSHLAPDGPPVLLVHRDCGGRIDDRRRCDKCGAELQRRDLQARRGPGARAAA